MHGWLPACRRELVRPGCLRGPLTSFNLYLLILTVADKLLSYLLLYPILLRYSWINSIDDKILSYGNH